MIEINNVSKSFGSFKALDNISIKVKKGEIHGIIGENGAGKTTLIKCLVGIYKPDEGEILIDGSPVFENPTVKEKIGYVADSNAYFSDYSVKRMIKFFKEVYKDFDEEFFYRLNDVFNLDIKRMVGRLSKGQQMRLAFMLNIACSPKVLVLDEPTSGLDVIAKRQLMDILIEQVEKKEITVIISSHHLSELEKLCDSLTIINNGKIQYESDLDTLREQVKKLQVVFDREPDRALLEKSFKVERIGSVYYLTTDNYTLNTQQQLKDMGATIVEQVGMSLEEIFIFTTGKGVI